MKHKPKTVKVRGVFMRECRRCHERWGVADTEKETGKCKK